MNEFEDKFGEFYDTIRVKAKEANKSKEKKNEDLIWGIYLLTMFYKIGRIIDKKSNVLESIKNISEKINPKNENEVVKSLKELDEIIGVGIPVASALLHFFYEEIPIIDKYSYRALMNKVIPSKAGEIKRDYVIFYDKYKKRFSKKLKKDNNSHKKLNFNLMKEGEKLLKR